MTNIFYNFSFVLDVVNVGFHIRSQVSDGAISDSRHSITQQLSVESADSRLCYLTSSEVWIMLFYKEYIFIRFQVYIHLLNKLIIYFTFYIALLKEYSVTYTSKLPLATLWRFDNNWSKTTTTKLYVFTLIAFLELSWTEIIVY